jgi:hypothetical protein
MYPCRCRFTLSLVPWLLWLQVFERKGREPQQTAFLSISMFEGVCSYFSAWTVVCKGRQTYVTKSKEENLKFPIYLLVSTFDIPVLNVV